MEIERKKPFELGNHEKCCQKISYRVIRNWDESEIIDLYRAGGWWEMGLNPLNIPLLMHGSFLFVIALDTGTDHAVGMGRIISDGSSDGYIQDVVVHHDYRENGIGTAIVSLLRSLGLAFGLSWMGLISVPGEENFYKRAGFSPMKNHIPMNLDEKRSNRCHDTQ
jgi:GNAT superfamily N-acetyltransferase